jgi:hypothetical protein
MLANLATLSDEAAGLGTSDWFAEDSLEEDLLTPSGLIPVPRLNLAPEDLGAPLRAQLAVS